MPKWCSTSRAWFFVIVAITALALIGLAGFLEHEGLDRADKWSSVVFGAAGAVAVAAGALFRLWRLSDPHDEGYETALSRLADAQRELWTAEQAARRVRDPWPLNVRWLSSARAQAAMASWASVRGAPGVGAVDLDGGYDQVAGLLERSDVPRRLVVLGDPGAGKSMLVLHLTLELLGRRGAGEPVPVLLTAAGWNPVQPLDDWVAAQIAGADRRMARMVTAPDGGRRSLARDLVARGLILPVLDGLDEMNDELQRAALIGISAAAVAGRELVVTSRTLPYEAAVRACGPLPAATVVELQPVTPVEAAHYLADSVASTDHRWSSVVDQLNTASVTPLAEALSTPLMIWLARMVYRSPQTDPGELLTAGWATSRQGIEEYLLDRLIPAVYAMAQTRYPARSAAEIDRTRGWLSVLARHMRAQRTYDLAWWQISEISPAPMAQLISIVYVILAASMVNVFAFALSAPVLLPDSGGPWIGSLFIGAWIGILMAFGRMLFTDRHYPRRITLHGMRKVFLAAGAPLCLIVVPTGSLRYGLSLALTAGVVAALSSGSEVAPSTAGFSASLRSDRTAALVSGGCIGAVTVALFTVGIGLTDPIPWLAGSATGLAAILLSAWGQFQLATLVLASLHRVPPGLVRALHEARHRGVLRRAGSVYQFRHGLLRNRLSDAEDHPRLPTASA